MQQDADERRAAGRPDLLDEELSAVKEFLNIT